MLCCRSVLGWIKECLPPLQHVAHAAGVSAFDMIENMTNEQLWAIASPKVDSFSQ